MAFPVTLNGRTYTLTDFEGTNYVDGLPDAFEDFVTQAGQIYSTTSTTSNSIGTGSKTFTVEASKPYQVGTPLRIADTAAVSTNWIDGIVTAYSGTTLTVNAVAYAGSGTKTAWSINIGGGPIAYTGTLPIAQGGTGATTAAAARTNIDVYSKADADSRFLNVSGEASDVVLNGDLTVDTDTLYVDSANNRIGIGTISPARTLELYSSAPAVKFNNGTNAFSIGTGAFVDGSNSLVFFDEGVGELMRISGGNVGIGTASPTPVSGSVALEIEGVGSQAGAEVIIGSADTTATAGDLFGGLAFKSIDSNGTPPHYSGIKATAADTFGGASLAFYAGRSNYESNDPRFVIEGPQSVSGEALRILSSGGITFNGDTAAANALSDYEEGTWTPTPTNGSLSFVKAWYIKIGNLVTVSANIYNFSDTTSSNAVGIKDLPYTSSSSASAVGAIIGRYISSSTGYSAYLSQSSTTIFFYEAPEASNAYETMKHSDLGSANSDFHFTITYTI